MPGPHPKPPRRSVVLDLSSVLAWLLIAAFALIAIVVVWGLVTKQLNLTAVVSVLATIFSGVLAGALLPHGKPAAQAPEDEEDDEP